MRVYFKTFGCRVNQYETESLRRRLSVGACQASSAQLRAAEVARYDAGRIDKIRSFDSSQHGSSTRTGRLAVVIVLGGPVGQSDGPDMVRSVMHLPPPGFSECERHVEV